MDDISVLLLDDDRLLLEMMTALFLSEGVACIGVGSVEELIATGERALACDLAILDVNLGPAKPSGIDAFRWLKSQSFSGRIVFLTGHARSYIGVAEAAALGVEVLEKPMSVAGLLNLVGRDSRSYGD
jgi:FixJ family two-component response regulator